MSLGTRRGLILLSAESISYGVIGRAPVATARVSADPLPNPASWAITVCASVRSAWPAPEW